MFGWHVYSTPAIGVAASPPMKQMEEVLAPDPRTVVIRWKDSYPDAGRMREGFEALPRHILESVFRDGDVEALTNHAYWTQQYVGLGPYRLDRWEPGTWIEAVAFDQHALGRPKIDRVKVLLATDPNAALATYLSGDAHIIIDNMLRIEDVPLIKSKGATVLSSPLGFRIMQIQLRPEMGARPELANQRVRAAISHLLDKQGINDALDGGESVVTDTMVSPLFDYSPQVAPAITRHPSDPRRAQQLLEEAGLSRGPDGFYTSLSGSPMSIEVGTTQSPAIEAENAIHIEGFKRIGLNAHTFVLTVAMLRDNQAVTTFSGVFATGRTGGEDGLGDYTTTNIPTAENRWLGGNRGGWSNSTYDRLYQEYNSILDRSERIQRVAAMEKLVSEDVAAAPLMYTPRLIAHMSNLKGPVARASRDAMEIVHVDQWEWLS